MNQIVLYAHGGCGNHGCEALVRTTFEIVNQFSQNKIKVISNRPYEDKKYYNNERIDYVIKGHSLNIVQKTAAKIYRLLTGSIYLYERIEMSELVNNTKNSLCFSIGGDNYCYSDYERLCRLNSYLKKEGNKTVLWGCSVSPELIKTPAITKDLKNYSLITARESITFNAMKNAGLDNVLYCPDSAFLLQPQKTDLPGIFNTDTVGINISPLVLSYEKDSGMTLKNYVRLIEHIINETNMNIAFIPHVVWDFSNDLEPILTLYNKYKDTGRVALIDEQKELNACQLKYIISKCRYLVTARTHASVAAYSSGVPALVTGYSVKARGIAEDIFGTCEGYVCPVQNMKTENDLLNGFLFICKNEEQIKAAELKFTSEAEKYFFDVKKHISELCE